MALSLWIAVGGVCGTLARYGLSLAMHRALGERFAWGTLSVNLLGCFLIGLLMQLGLSGSLISRELRAALGIGFMGAFTTFSTFGYETLSYIQDGNWRLALLNAAANLVLGLLLVWLGMLAGRGLTGGG
ncbi:fluoride efflux transporter CrcB [bacterium]|nr:fluoride efflux transporter CrcB [bacterium]